MRVCVCMCVHCMCVYACVCMCVCMGGAYGKKVCGEVGESALDILFKHSVFKDETGLYV